MAPRKVVSCIMMQATDQAEVTSQSGLSGEKFTQVHTWDRALYGLPYPTVFGWCFWLEVI